jgi:hypothetical protein
MNKVTKLTSALSLIGASVLGASATANAAVTTTCTSIAYLCTPGYAGADGQYSYSEWANTNAYGYPHNCTMYIAWLFTINLPYHSEFNLLGDASGWPDNFINFGLNFDSGLPGSGGGNGSPGIINLNSVDGPI